MDIVFLRDLRIDAVIGIYGWERRTRQTLIFDLEMSADVARAAATDAIEDTLNYKSVAKRLIEFVGASDFQLVETLAERCAEIIREEYGVRWVRLFYLYPETLSDALVTLLAEHPRVVPYVDMPLQHAADAMLRRMRRGHGGKRLRDCVERKLEGSPS